MARVNQRKGRSSGRRASSAREFADKGKLYSSASFEPVSKKALEGIRLTEGLEGKTIHGAYRVSNLLGTGAMALVYKAEEIRTGRMVALKTLKYHDPILYQRFAREVRVHSKLKHPSIVKALACLEDEQTKQSYFIMELLKGESLEKYLEEHEQISDVDDIASVLSQTCDSIEYAHQQGVIHRDLKPDNIMLERTEEGLTAKVLDFGLAMIQEDLQRITRTGVVVGTPAYMSPEQCMGEDIDGRSDLYSLTVIAYDLVAGGMPFEAGNHVEMMRQHSNPNKEIIPLREYRPDLPAVDDLDSIFRKGLSFEKEERYQSINELKKDLDYWWRLATEAVPGTISPFNFVEEEEQIIEQGESAGTGTKNDKLSQTDPDVLIDLVERHGRDRARQAASEMESARPAQRPRSLNKAMIAAIAFFVLMLIGIPLVIMAVTSQTQDQTKNQTKDQAGKTSSSPQASPSLDKEHSSTGSGNEESVVEKEQDKKLKEEAREFFKRRKRMMGK